MRKANIETIISNEIEARRVDAIRTVIGLYKVGITKALLQPTA